MSWGVGVKNGTAQEPLTLTKFLASRKPDGINPKTVRSLIEGA